MIINKRQWEIIKNLSKGNKTPTELAKILKVSLPAIHNQLKELEQKQLIKKVGEIKGKTRPYAVYSLEEGFIYYMKALPNETEQVFLPVDENIKLHLRIWSIPQKEYHYYLESFWWNLQDHLSDLDAVVLYGSVAEGEARKGSDLDLLLLVNKNVKRYEKYFGAKMVGPKGKQKMVMCQIFKTEDFANSFKKGSSFAAEVVKNGVVIYDPENNFFKLKNGS